MSKTRPDWTHEDGETGFEAVRAQRDEAAELLKLCKVEVVHNRRLWDKVYLFLRANGYDPD